MTRWEWQRAGTGTVHAYETGARSSICGNDTRRFREYRGVQVGDRTCRTCSRMTLAAAPPTPPPPPEHPWWAVWIAATSFDREETISRLDQLLDEWGPALALDPKEPEAIIARNELRRFENTLRARYGPRLIRRDSTLPRDRIGWRRRVPARS